MPSLILNYNFGASLEENPVLNRQLSDIYRILAQALNTKVSKFVTSGANPPANDQFNVNFDIGDIYVRTDTDTAWIMTSRKTSQAVTWTQIT